MQSAVTHKYLAVKINQLQNQTHKIPHARHRRDSPFILISFFFFLFICGNCCSRLQLVEVGGAAAVGVARSGRIVVVDITIIALLVAAISESLRCTTPAHTHKHSHKHTRTHTH